MWRTDIKELMDQLWVKMIPYPCFASSCRSKPFPVPMSSTLHLDKSPQTSSFDSDLLLLSLARFPPPTMFVHKFLVQDATTSITSTPNLDKGKKNEIKLWQSLNFFCWKSNLIRSFKCFTRIDLQRNKQGISCVQTRSMSFRICTNNWYTAVTNEN